jgi:opacity protein-like surface antigen
MNQKMYEIKTLLNIVGNTAAAAGSAVTLLPSATIARREVKVIVISQIQTQGTFSIGLTECDTSNGTFTDVGGDSITAVAGTNAAVAVAEYHVKPTKAFMKAAVTTVAGTTATANLIVLVQNLKRSSQ